MTAELIRRGINPDEISMHTASYYFKHQDEMAKRDAVTGFGGNNGN